MFAQRLNRAGQFHLVFFKLPKKGGHFIPNRFNNVLLMHPAKNLPLLPDFNADSKEPLFQIQFQRVQFCHFALLPGVFLPGFLGQLGLVWMIKLFGIWINVPIWSRTADITFG